VLIIFGTHVDRNADKNKNIRNMKKLIIINFLLVGVFLLSSCKKEISPVNESEVAIEPGADIKSVTFPEDFAWKTFSDIDVTLNGTKNALVTISSIDHKVYSKAYLKAGKELKLKLTIPAYETKVRIFYAGYDIEIDIDGNSINYSF